MTDEIFLETFAPGVEFLLNNKLYRVIKSKRLLSQKYMIVTDFKTFQKSVNDLEDFINEIEFIGEVEEKRKQKEILKTEKTKEIVEKTQNTQPANLTVINDFKPSATVAAKPVLTDLLDKLSSMDKIDEELIKKTNAICSVTKQIIEISKLEVDVLKTVNKL